MGSRIHVNRYIQQFTEIFTEEGRKSVKITHQVQGHPPRVMYTHSMREKERLREKEEKQQQLQQQQQPVVQQIPINKDATEAQPVNPTPIPPKVLYAFCFYTPSNSKTCLHLSTDGKSSNLGNSYQNGLARKSQIWSGITGHSHIGFITLDFCPATATTTAAN